MQDLIEQIRPYLDSKDIVSGIVIGLILSFSALIRRWIMSRQRRLAASFLVAAAAVIIVLIIWKYAVIMDAVVSVFTFKVNVWILVSAYVLVSVLVTPWFFKNIHKIAAEVGGARNEVFIQEGKALLDKPFDWLAQSDPSNPAHGAFKVIQLQGQRFYELDCSLEYSPSASPKLCIGILLMEEPIKHFPDLREMSATDVYSGVDLFTDGLKARIIEGGAKRAFRKDVHPAWRSLETGLRQVHLRFVVNDGCNLAVLVDGQFMFAKPIHNEALKHLALFVHTRPSASFQATVREITIRVAKSEGDLFLERRARQTTSRIEPGSANGGVSQ
jgi:hypothetical protein